MIELVCNRRITADIYSSGGRSDKSASHICSLAGVSAWGKRGRERGSEGKGVSEGGRERDRGSE